MAGLVPAIHVFAGAKTWMAGTRPSAGPAMTVETIHRRRNSARGCRAKIAMAQNRSAPPREDHLGHLRRPHHRIGHSASPARDRRGDGRGDAANLLFADPELEPRFLDRHL